MWIFPRIPLSIIAISLIMIDEYSNQQSFHFEWNHSIIKFIPFIRQIANDCRYRYTIYIYYICIFHSRICFVDWMRLIHCCIYIKAHHSYMMMIIIWCDIYIYTYIHNSMRYVLIDWETDERASIDSNENNGHIYISMHLTRRLWLSILLSSSMEFRIYTYIRWVIKN